MFLSRLSHRRSRLLFFLLIPPLLLGIALLVLASKRPQPIPISHNVNSPIAISSDGRFIATINAGSIDFVNIYDCQTNHQTSIRTSPAVGSLAFLPDNISLVAGGSSPIFNNQQNGQIEVYDARTATLTRRFAQSELSGSAVAVVPGGTMVAFSGVYGRIVLFDAATGQRLKRLDGAPAFPDSLVFSSGGQRLLAGHGSNVMVFDVPRRKLLWSAAVPQTSGLFDAVSSSISPDGRSVAVGSQNGKVAFLDGRTGAFLRMGTLPLSSRNFGPSSPSDATRYVAFSPDSRLLASGGWHGVAVWNVADGTLRQEMPGCAGVGFSGDGKRLATGSSLQNSSITLWKSF